MEEERHKKRAERKRLEKESGLVFKKGANGYDSDEDEFERRMDRQEEEDKVLKEQRAKGVHFDDEDYEVEELENSYDSELEAEFFGARDPDANETAFGKLEEANAEK